ncbi:MAG: DNA polymerase III subunit beta [Dysgonamonadaceae bacterium]|jgi:DNA polymerase-3 subunit beta|nr:DNA polymerase III subunit beta [Dysgonamonadaceae bacterium]
MKFVVSSNLLLNQLQTIGRVIASKNSIPILDCFLFDLNEDLLTITACDSETRMSTSLKVNDIEGSGIIAIPSRNLLDALKELPEQPITFNILEENLELYIYYENGKYNFTGQNGDEYPQPKPLNEDAARLDIPAPVLLSGISRTLFATAEDELRPVMNGLFFDITTDDITFVASDGHKLVRSKTFAVKGSERSSFILPKKPANLLKTILPKESGDISIQFDNSNAYITMEDFTLVCRLIEGRYPNYNGVIPTQNPYKITVDRLLLHNALKRVSVFSNSTSSLVKLTISETQILISAQDIDFSTFAEETIPCVYDGTAMNIGFRGTYLIEILNNIPSQDVILELADPSRAGLILPVENEENEDLLMLLMPMMLND